MLTSWIWFCFLNQGLFRITAGASKLKKLKAALDCSTSQLEEFYSDPHAVAGIKKTTGFYYVILKYFHFCFFLVCMNVFFFCLFLNDLIRSFEVLPKGTARASYDLWTLWWVDSGIQVSQFMAYCFPSNLTTREKPNCFFFFFFFLNLLHFVFF